MEVVLSGSVTVEKDYPIRFEELWWFFFLYEWWPDC